MKYAERVVKHKNKHTNKTNVKGDNISFWNQPCLPKKKNNTCSNSVDPDGMARTSRLIRIYIVCHSGFHFRLKPQFASVDQSESKNRRVYFRNWGITRLKKLLKIMTRKHWKSVLLCDSWSCSIQTHLDLKLLPLLWLQPEWRTNTPSLYEDLNSDTK